MDPQKQPYRQSWAPFGRARRTMSPGEQAASGVPSRSVGRVRTSMAPVQVTRWAHVSAVQRADLTASIAANAGPPDLRPPPAPPQPHVHQPYVQQSYALPSHAQQAPAPLPFTQRPPAYRRSLPGSRPPGPGTRRYAQAPRTAGARPPAPITGPPRPTEGQRVASAGARRPGTVPFDVLALVAFVMAFIAGPLGLILGVAALRRARTRGTPTALAWLSLLIAGFTTFVTLGFGTLVVQAFSSLGS